MNNLKRYRVVPMICIMGTIFFLSHQPGSAFFPPLFPGEDKVAHFSIYFLLAVSVIAAFYWPVNRDYKVRLCSMVGVVAFCAAYGISDELHQAFIPGRSPSVADLLADTAGACAAVLCWKSLQGRMRNKITS